MVWWQIMFKFIVLSLSFLSFVSHSSPNVHNNSRQAGASKDGQQQRCKLNIQTVSFFDVGIHSLKKFARQETDIQKRIDQYSNFRSRDFSDCNFENSKFKGISFNYSNFENANLRGVQFIRTRLYGARLVNADLSSASFKDVNLYKADLRGADLRGIDLRSVKVNRTTNFQGAKYDDKTKFLRSFNPKSAGMIYKPVKTQ